MGGLNGNSDKKPSKVSLEGGEGITSGGVWWGLPKIEKRTYLRFNEPAEIRNKEGKECGIAREKSAFYLGG